MKISNLFKSVLTVTAMTLMVSCSDDDTAAASGSNANGGDLKINFDAVVGSQDFALDTPFSVNGHSYTFERLRYWVSNVELVAEDGTVYSVPESYYLLEETGEVSVQDGTFTYPAKKREVVELKNIPAGHYSKIRFAVGVDPTYNDNMSLQSGELSQMNGMTNVSWMWHTSYIFSSLIGKDDTQAPIQVETGLNSNYRTVEVALPSGVHVGTDAAKVNLNVEIAKIVEGLDLHTTPTVSASTPAEMTQVADNYKTKVFTLKSVE
ncbi:MbnP family protein [Flavobacterium sp. DGU11]|uniref:MbnP family protein n=1 Tax=Flavobacterium arundinis TaxID=3139143 RepID=A0ABU9HVS2_9FLAO